MDFETDEDDYSVREFFDRFNLALPKFVMVTQGFCGEILEDTFDRGQVLRIHTVSRQHRVVAKQADFYRMAVKWYSLPLSYPIKMCHVKQTGKVGKEKTLKEIVHNATLPIDVRFSKNQHITVGHTLTSGSHFNQLHLTDTFDENYLLGNFLNDGVLDLQQVVGVPLYLSDLRLAEVTGLKGQTADTWKRYTGLLDKQVKTFVSFDAEYGSKDIAVYHPDAIKSDSEYGRIEPSSYTNLTDLDPQHSPHPPLSDSATDDSADEVKAEDKSSVARSSPLTTRGKKEKTVTHTESSSKETPQGGAFKASGSAAVSKGRAQREKDMTPHANVVPKSTTVSDASMKGASASKSNEGDSLRSDRRSSEPDVASLTIAELSEWLRTLKLGKYVQKFQEEMIDGAMLQEFDSAVLEEEFSLNKVESLTLVKFARDGHIPK